jgi:hypothetical protein
MILENYNCVLCSSQAEETLEHLFFHCPFAASCWALLAIHSLDALSRFQAVEAFKLVFNKEFFMEVFILLCWIIWIEKNDLIFKGLQPSAMKCKVNLKKELALLCFRVRSRSELAFVQWLESL